MPARAISMNEPPPFPAISSQNLSDARLYANREEMVRALVPPGPDIIGEVGVGLGDFSEFLIQTLRPRRFVAFDTFDLNNHLTIWGRPTRDIFQGQSHEEFVATRLSKLDAEITLQRGDSGTTLARQPDAHFDMLYIDADHNYTGVRRDASLAKQKLRANGTLIFNDYIIWDHVTHERYGVVPVVNELVTSEGWRIVGFALHPQLFCDIALRRPA